MLSEKGNASRLAILKLWTGEALSERRALVTLAVAAWLSFLVYVLLLVRPFSLLAYYRNNQLRLQSFADANPMVRFELAAAFVLVALLYWIGWRAVRSVSSIDAWLVVLWGSLASGVALLFVYPFGSTDIFDNIMHGRILSVYGGNPFVHVGHNFRSDPFYRYMGWPGAPSAYGPLWETMAGIIARFTGDGIVANVLAFKVLSALFLAGSIWLIAAILRHLAPARALPGVLLFAWNPIVLYETLANGHNDIVMVFWMLASALAIVKRRFTLAILALLVGVLIKFIPALLLPAAGLIALRELPDTRARVRFVLVTGLIGLALVILAYAPFWRGMDVLSIERRQRLFTTSLPAAIYTWLAPHWGKLQAANVVSKVAAGATLLVALWQGARAWQDRTRLSFVRASFATLMFYLLAACLWFMPWYVLWPLSLASLLPSGRSTRLAQLLGFAALFHPIVIAPLFLWGSPPPPEEWQQLGLASTFYAPPWLYLLLARSTPKYRVDIPSAPEPAAPDPVVK